MTSSVLVELERAELAARERRLAATAEVDRRIAAAEAEASRIRAGAEVAIRDAVDVRRREHLERARHAIAGIEAELAALETADADPAMDVRHAAAVERVVAAVLGEMAPDEREG